jgi:hypothetical protein
MSPKQTQPMVVPFVFPYKGYDKVHDPSHVVQKPPAPEKEADLEQAVADAMVPIMQGRHMPLDRVLDRLKRTVPFAIDDEKLKETVVTISEKYRRGEGPTTAAYVPPKDPEPPKPVIPEVPVEPDPKVIEEG